MPINRKWSILPLFIILSILLSGVQPVSALYENALKQHMNTSVDNNLSLLAANWYVSTTGNDANSCMDSLSPCLTINGAIGKATDGDTIYVAIGTFTGSGNEVVLINKSVTLSGGWNADFSTQVGLSTIDGQNARRGVSIYEIAIVVTMDHFKIINGFNAYQGGGIYSSAILNLNNSIISNNASNSQGGGIFNSGGAITINYTTISDNISNGRGGGIFSNNAARAGGYIVLNNSTISGNNILGYASGSAIENSILPFEINNSTISGNTTTWFDNIADAITNSGVMTVKNSTISGNSHGGISNEGFGSVMMQNSILANNTSSGFGHECSGDIDSAGYNLIGDAWFNVRGNAPGCTFNSTIGDVVGTTEDPLNPMLGPLQDNGGPTFTKAALSASPAINTGNPAMPGSGGNACLATDQRGVARPVDGICDIGAYEGAVPAIQISGSTSIGNTTLTYADDSSSQTVRSNNNGLYSIWVPVSWSGTVTPSKDTIIFHPGSRVYNNLLVDQTIQNYLAIADPSFEIFTPNPYWSEYSLNFGTPWCIESRCGYGNGTSGPRTGAGWMWFGGAPNDESSRISQTISIPSGYPDIKLQFYLRIGLAQPGSDTGDTFTAYIDDVPVFSANATDQSLYQTYKPVLVDLSPFANDQPHTIIFTGNTSTQVVNFSLDDVNLVNVKFLDVPSDYWALQFVERLYNTGITGGCSAIPLKYCPDNTVTRAQMAIFLLKGMHGANYSPPPIGGNTGFGDVPANYWAAAWIKQLAAENITSGCGGGNYCPETTVTRDQMAIFLLKAKHGSSYSPPNATGIFTDVPTGYWADKWIEQLAVEGITGGCGAGVYCPTNSVTRAQMAVFLVRAFNLP